VLTWLIDFVDRVRQRRTDARLRVHSAFSADGTPVYCLNIQNVSPQRDVTVTHVWIASEPEVPARPPDAPIKSGAQWETCIPVRDLPPGTEKVERLARARLGNDTELKSVPRKNVPTQGCVPGQQQSSTISGSRLSVVSIKASDDPGSRAVEQRPVVPLDHPHTRSHDLRQLEHRDAGSDSSAGEGRTEIVDPRGSDDT
jgi:hypothetical protein